MRPQQTLRAAAGHAARWIACMQWRADGAKKPRMSDCMHRTTSASNADEADAADAADAAG
ncbi:hypothetical protein [Xanthomonas oryzae]|uniref:hypothetical protein n=1 Tax=Xanthomonas oryzae TaxID=347 RepID=UPI0006AC456E|nr:hypothetical protein [Xanthomonas oryzae]UNE62559.1 hypothetical protein MML47_20775 [Xanthomonas oryzae]